jgi:hypothetical protein
VAASTIEKLAGQLGVSERTLNTWIARGCPRGPLKKIREWKEANILPRKGGPRKTRDESADRSQRSLQQRVNEANADKAEQDARYKQIKADLLERRLVPIDQVVREAAELFAEIRSILETIPDATTKEMCPKCRERSYEVERAKVDAALKKLVALHLVGGSNPDGA